MKHSPTNSSSISSSQDKKQYDKQPTKNRIGQAFRNSWGRKDSEHKAAKKGVSMPMVMTFLFINAMLCYNNFEAFSLHGVTC